MRCAAAGRDVRDGREIKGRFEMRCLLVFLALTPLFAKDPEPVKRLDEAAAVFAEIMAIPDKGIPQDLLAKAHCIVIVPGLKKGAFIRRQVRQRILILSKEKRGGLVCSGYRSH